MEQKNELSGSKALQYLLEHGLVNLSLRPLAEAIGSSSRILIYHFGTKEGLIRSVMDEARLRLRQSLASFLSTVFTSNPIGLVRSAVSIMSRYRWTLSSICC
jgi:AcrR family transcriptional regulator